MMCFKGITLCFLLIIIQNTNGMHPNVGLDEYQIMTKYGYPYEKHYVTTEDGYILEISRILPRNPNIYTNLSIPFKVYPHLKAKKPGEPILLMHGLMCTGRVFVSHDADKALAFILVNHGYDVYLGNARGVANSRRHLTLDPELNSEKFWDFTVYEIGVYDQPAMIDYILALTGFPQVSFVGHSQGGTTLLTMTATRPETNSKIKIGFSLGGPGVFRHTPNALVRRWAQYDKDVQAMMNRLKIYEFIRYAPVFMDLAKIMTDEQFGLKNFLSQMLNTVDIITTHNMDVELMPVLATSSPAGTSVNQVIHIMQAVRHGQFQAFDYNNKIKNIEKYGSDIPPIFNLSAITCKAVLYYSNYDFFIREKDALIMSNQMQNAVPVEIKVKHFSHTDFLWARNIYNYMFKDLLERLRNA